MARNHFASDSIWRLAAVAIGHESLRTLDLRGMAVSMATVRRIGEKSRYKRCEIKCGELDEAGKAESEAIVYF